MPDLYCVVRERDGAVVGASVRGFHNALAEARGLPVLPTMQAWWAECFEPPLVQRDWNGFTHDGYTLRTFDTRAAVGATAVELPPEPDTLNWFRHEYTHTLTANSQREVVAYVDALKALLTAPHALPPTPERPS